MIYLLGKISHFASILSKLSLSIAIFFIAARILGPETYGEIAIYFTYGIFFGQLTEYGSCQKLIRDAASPGERVESHIWSGFFNKAPALIFAAGGVIIIMTAKGTLEAELLLCVVGYFVCNAYIDLLLASQRAIHKFITEAVLALVANVSTLIVSLYFLISCGVAGFFYSLLFFRALVLLLLLLFTLKNTRTTDLSHAASQFVPNIKDSFYFGLDSLANSLMPTLTLLALSLILAPALFGQLQLLQKIIQGCNTLSMIAIQKHFPILARRVGGVGYDEVVKQYYRDTIIVSLISVMSIMLLPFYHQAIGLVSGGATTISALILLIIVRYQAAYQGVRLTVECGARMKSKVSLCAGVIGLLASAGVGLLAGSVNSILLVEALQVTVMAVFYVKNRAAT